VDREKYFRNGSILNSNKRRAGAVSKLNGIESACLKPTDKLGQSGVAIMSKGNDSRKQEKKKPLKTLMEKRAAKRAKKENKFFALVVK
jgi:hypothetical protein